MPAAYKGESWARLGVDVDNGFKPLYVVSTPKKSVVANLKRLLKTADELYLATDEDREGESIAWHLSEVLNPTVPVKRMVFHEITPTAIARAVEEWRDLDRRLVDGKRRGASSIASTATRCRRSCGARSCRGSRRDGCRVSPPAWWSSGNGRACGSARRRVGH